jgi:hypothetical protein
MLRGQVFKSLTRQLWHEPQALPHCDALRTVSVLHGIDTLCSLCNQFGNVCLDENMLIAILYRSHTAESVRFAPDCCTYIKRVEHDISLIHDILRQEFRQICIGCIYPIDINETTRLQLQTLIEAV